MVQPVFRVIRVIRGKISNVSEDKFQAELDTARVLSRKNATECRRSQKDIRQVEIRVIEEIEELRPELEPDRLAQVRVLDH